MDIIFNQLKSCLAMLHKTVFSSWLMFSTEMFRMFISKAQTCQLRYGYYLSKLFFTLSLSHSHTHSTYRLIGTHLYVLLCRSLQKEPALLKIRCSCDSKIINSSHLYLCPPCTQHKSWQGRVGQQLHSMLYQLGIWKGGGLVPRDMLVQDEDLL